MIDIKKLKETIEYNEMTGDFVWLVSKQGNRGIGSKAGNKTDKGYIQIKFERKCHLAHRLAWFYANGEWPKSQIDHINGIKSDNRIANLREATPSQNNCNIGLSSRNKSGIKGVHWDSEKGKWRARVVFRGKRFHGGLFSQVEDAANSAKKLREQLHGEFAMC